MNWNQILHYVRTGNPVPEKRVEKKDEEWMEQLGPEVFRILREHGTEMSFSGEYCEAHDPGLYACRGCGNLLFDSSIKFDSGTGWPSFTQPIQENAIKYLLDTSYGMQRVEIQCNVCDGHLGHVFPDGPKPSGLRYCVNSASIELEQG